MRALRASAGTSDDSEPLRAVVAGGSLGGLFAGLALADAGCEVEVFEKSDAEMESRGAGIVVQPETAYYLERYGASTESVSTSCTRRQYLKSDGGVAQEGRADQRFISWGVLYRSLKAAFPEERYHTGTALVGFEQDEERVIARFAERQADGHEEVADLLVCADGSGSTARSLLLPGVSPEYAGYVAWRGLVDEDEVPALAGRFAERFTFFHMPDGHILCYLIPGPNGELAEGKRRLNWVWYVNVPEGEELETILTDKWGEQRQSSVPPGDIRQEVVEDLKGLARTRLPDVFRELVEATEEPFIQTIYDLSVPQMAFGRVCLLGDAAFVPRPHTAASTSKAAANALEFAEHVRRSGGEVAEALRRWEARQLKLGNYLKRVGQSLGDRSQFGGHPPPRRGIVTGEGER